MLFITNLNPFIAETQKFLLVKQPKGKYKQIYLNEGVFSDELNAFFKAIEAIADIAEEALQTFVCCSLLVCEFLPEVLEDHSDELNYSNDARTKGN